MSADNYIGYHKVTGKRFWEPKWCVGEGSASMRDEDCQYRAGSKARFRTESQAIEAAHKQAERTIVLEYGVMQEDDWSQPFCGRCSTCIDERDVIASDIDRCTKCGEPFTETDWRMLNSEGTFHRWRCEPQKSNPIPVEPHPLQPEQKTSNLQKGD